MSEPKRVVPQCLEFPDSLGHATKKEKKREKGKQQLAPSFRFTIALPESNDKTYSEFNYAQLVKSAEKKRRKEESRVHDENATNGLDPFEDGDDDKLREMASRFEAKYGTATAGRKRHKHDDYVDLGAGYDENDSFIDNTDAYDEIVPREVTTAYGGFYINSGPLEFKPADENSPVHSRLNHNNNNNNNVEDEEEESSEESIDDEEEIGNRVLQRMEKRILSSSEEDDEEDLVSNDPPRKKHKSEENGEKKSSQSQENVMKRKRKVVGDSCNSSNNPSNQCEEVEAVMTGSTTTTVSVAAAVTTTTTTTSSSGGVMGKSGSVGDDKREILDVECSSEDQDEKKRTKYDTNKTKSTGGEKKYDVKKIDKKIEPKRPEKKHQPQQPQQQQQPQPQQPQQQQPQQQQQAPSNGIEVKKIDLKKLFGKDSNIDDAIESVVNAGRVVDESSHDSIDSNRSHFLPGSESECDDLDKDDTPLPEHLSDDVKDIINKLKFHADKNREGKNKIFDEHFNSILLVLEEKLRMMNSPIARLLTYGHLAPFLRCNKANLVTRAKKLCLQNAERRITIPFRRLKAIIEATMPGVVERYAKECQRVAEEKGLEASPAEVDSSDAENIERSKIPRKKFPWTPETKKLIYELANARRHYFKLRKPRKESMETFIATYMESKVLPLWPGGWVRLQTLLKYSNPEPAEKRKQKKSRDGGAMVNNLSALSGQSNSVVRQELLGMSMVSSSQEGGGMSGTNATKLTNENNLNFSPTHLKSGETTQQQQQQQQQQVDRKMSSKSREKNSASPVTQENPCGRGPGEIAKITVVPTSQLIGQNKGLKSVQEKFNPMDLTSSSLSITPVNDFSKSSKSSVLEMKKDVVSITPYSETTTTNVNDPVGGVKNGSTKRIQDGIEIKSEKRIIEESSSESSRKLEKREKRREKWHEEKRCQETKKRRKEQKSEQNVLASLKTETSISSQKASSLTKEEQEQRQIEETMAATNFLSQIINDDLAPRVSSSEKRKEQQNVVVEENVSNLVGQQQASEQDNDVQMVMRSLKELQELQEMKYSPGHSPIGGQQKSSKTSHQYVPYQDDYPRIYNKKDEKIRVPKEETSSW